MGRSGVRWDEIACVRDALDTPAFEGCYTQFHSADRNDGSIDVQTDRFRRAVAQLKRRPALLHVANSAGALRGRRYAFDLVRPGVFLYGGSPGAGLPEPRPVVRVRARVVSVRHVRAGESVSYGALWTAPRQTTVATLGIGYADGLRRSLGLSGRGAVLLRGRRCPIIGAVTMDLCMVEVEDLRVQVGDGGSDTLGNVARAVGGLRLPNLERLGLGRCRPIPGLSPAVRPAAAHGVALPRSQGKDSTTGHWEICGVLLDQAFRTYPQGFPEDIIREFARRTGRGVIGNKAASGTAIITELGEEHQRTGKWIVYTSADSVFQVAAHEATVPLEELYGACRTARELLIGEHAVSRVIARPFVGRPGAYARTPNRRDFSIEPVGTTLLDRLAAAGVPRGGVGKGDDLFAGRHIASEHPPTNADAYRLIEQALARVDTGVIFVNVIEVGPSWGHRNDLAGRHAGARVP